MIASIDRESGFELFNVCMGKKTTVEEVGETICEALPYPVTVEYTGGTPGDQFGIYGDAKKIYRQLEWSATVDFRDGMKK